MIDLSLLKKLYTINSYSGSEKEMTNFLVTYLKTHYTGLKVKTDNLGNIYVTKGKAKNYGCVVAHQDQVQQPPDSELVIIQKNKIISAYTKKGQQWGLGADDKNGIWICLQLLKTEPILKCAFFVGEEVGCIGSSQCDMSFFKNVKYVLQCDRRGNSDIIYNTYSTELCNDDFIPIDLLQKYGYSPTTGLMTDVETLKEKGLNVACCNISCGYYNPHTLHETTNVNDLINCLNFVKEIIAITPLTKHEYDPTKNYYSLQKYYGGYFWNNRSTKSDNSSSSQTSTSNYNTYNKYYDWYYDPWDDMYY